MSTAKRSLKQQFLDALAVPPAERAAWLSRECAHDAALRQQIELMLAAHDAPQSLLDRVAPPAVCPGPVTETYVPETIPAGTSIGSYKLLQVIGEGGMGVVYMAEQTVPVERRVALKIIKPGMDTRQVIARFEAERQALAMMDHPNIAKVFDAGTTNSGRPYFVMELVRGIPITKYCDEHQLTLKQRLELFLPVCQAVQHAHQKGIIHRDLKPSNVLVAQYDDKPVPKVIDFGVAKAAQKLTERTMFTEFGQVVGTLEYMSPEQARLNQLDIDTRSDIYSLGVLLYELLTGCTPFDGKRLRSAAFDEVLRIIREEEPPKPSTRLSSASTLPSIAANRHIEPTRLSRTIRGELDWIVMKALEKDRNRRYETANGFARDIERYLSDEPVQACPPSAVYRLRKFARRNTRALASTALLAIAVLAVATTLGWAIRDREAHLQKEAQERSERHAAVDREVRMALKEAEQFQKQSKWSDALSAAKRAQGLLASGGGEESLQRANQLREDLELVLRLEANRAQQWDEYGFDHESRSRAYARAFTEFGIDLESLSPPEVAAQIVRRPATAVRVAGALDEWAQLLRDWGLHDPTRDSAEWKRLLEAARLADPDPWRSQLRQLMGQEDLDALRKLADASDITALPVHSLLLMGSALAIGGDGPACITWLRRAHQQHPGDALISFDLAFHLSSLPSPEWAESLRFAEAALAAQPNPFMYAFVGIALSCLGRHDEAVSVYHKAIKLKPDYTSAHIHLGNSFRAQGKLDEALGAYREAGRLLSEESGDNGTAGKAITRMLSNGYGACGEILSKAGRFSEAVAAFDKARELDPDNDLHCFQAAAMHLYLGDVERYRGDCRALLDHAEKVAVDDVVVAERVAKTCSLAPQSVSDFSRVERLAQRAITGTEGHRYYHYFVLAKGLTEYRAGRDAEAINWFVRFKPRSNGGPYDATAFAVLAMAKHRLGRTEEAKTLWFDAQAILTQKFPDPSKGQSFAHDSEPWIHCEILCGEARNVLGAFSAGEVAEARLRHLGANCEDFLTLAIAHASRKEVDRAGLFLAAAHQRLERYCDDVRRAKQRLAEAISVLESAGVSLPHEPPTASDRLQRFNQVLEVDPEAAWAYELRGQIYAETGDRKQAETDYRLAFELLAKRGGMSIDDAEQVHRFADGAQARQQWGLSVAAYERLIELRLLNKWPKPWLGVEWPHHERGLAYTWMLDYERAEAEYTKGIELSPDFVGLWARRGSIRVGKREYDKAVEDYSRAIRLQPDHSPGWPWDDYRHALLQLGRWPEAAAEFKKIRQSQPQNVNVAYQHALALLGAGDLKGYRSVCHEMTQQFGGTSDIPTAHWVAWACALGPDALEDPGPVVALAEKATSAEPHNLQYLTTLGAMLCRAGRWKDAIERLNEADRRSAEPSEGAASSPAYAWLFLAMAYDRLGDKAEADRWHTKAKQYSEESLQAAAANSTVAWIRVLSLRLLLQETTQMPEQPPLPAD